MAEIKNSMDRAQELFEAREEAAAEGRAEGRAEVARNALAQGLEPEIVQKITGLDIQTITGLKQAADNSEKQPTL
jgi:hypothetical protein